MKIFLFSILKKGFSVFSNLIFRLMDFKLFRSVSRVFVRYFSPRKDVQVNVQGNCMYASTADRIVALLLWKYSSHEDYEFSLMDNILQEGMTAIDIGANIGYYTLHIAKCVGPQGKVYAFEPDPENHRLLVKNIEANHYRNIIAIQKAVSKENGKTDLFFCEEHRGDHRIYDSHDGRKKY